MTKDKIVKSEIKAYSVINKLIKSSLSNVSKIAYYNKKI